MRNIEQETNQSDGGRHERPRSVQAPDLDSTELYVNRELSWLDFNERVLELAEDEATPLMEQVKFLAIYSSNLDEFMMVRVAGLHDQVDAGIDARKADGLSPLETIERIAERTRELAAAPVTPLGGAGAPAPRRGGHPGAGCATAARPRSWSGWTASSTSRSSPC